jgi:hypothetical protein
MLCKKLLKRLKIVKELISRDMIAAKNSVNVLDYEVHAFAG